MKFETFFCSQTFVSNKAVPPAASPKQIAIDKQKSPSKVPPHVPSNCEIAVIIPTVPPSKNRQ